MAGARRGPRTLGARSKKETVRSQRAEAEMREGAKRYRAIYDKTPVMMYSVDRDFRLLTANRFFHDALGYSRQEVVWPKRPGFLDRRLAAPREGGSRPADYQGRLCEGRRDAGEAKER